MRKNLQAIGYIYIITNNLNGKSYIGSTLNYKRRIKRHISNAFSSKPPECGSDLYPDIKKYGLDNFTIKILESVILDGDDTILRDKEKYYINKFKTIENGYNCILPKKVGPIYNDHLENKDLKEIDQETKNTIVGLYSSGDTIASIVIKTGVPRWLIHNILQDNIDIKSNRTNNPTTTYKKDYIKIKNAQKYEMQNSISEDEKIKNLNKNFSRIVKINKFNSFCCCYSSLSNAIIEVSKKNNISYNVARNGIECSINKKIESFNDYKYAYVDEQKTPENCPIIFIKKKG